jgi:hypothetical protein
MMKMVGCGWEDYAFFLIIVMVSDEEGGRIK